MIAEIKLKQFNKKTLLNPILLLNDVQISKNTENALISQWKYILYFQDNL